MTLCRNWKMSQTNKKKNWSAWLRLLLTFPGWGVLTKNVGIEEQIKAIHLWKKKNTRHRAGVIKEKCTWRGSRVFSFFSLPHLVLLVCCFLVVRRPENQRFILFFHQCPHDRRFCKGHLTLLSFFLFFFFAENMFCFKTGMGRTENVPKLNACTTDNLVLLGLRYHLVDWCKFVKSLRKSKL